MGKVDYTEGYSQDGGGSHCNRGGREETLSSYSRAYKRRFCARVGHGWLANPNATPDTGPKFVADRVSEISQPVTEQLVIFIFVTMHMYLVIYQCI
jgi:hypothetical protein